MDKETVKTFVRELSELSRKHKIIIGACGCCYSPFLLDLEKDGQYEIRERNNGEFDDLNWEPTEKKS